MPKGYAPTDPEVRFWRFVDKNPKGCWLWTGGTNGRYGRFFAGGRRDAGAAYAHRWSYEHFVGPIPDALEINHLCLTPLCVRPDHLEVTTPRANIRYGVGQAARKARQTMCVNGHPFNEANTYIKPNGCRTCRACHRERRMRYYYAQKDATAAR